MFVVRGWLAGLNIMACGNRPTSRHTPAFVANAGVGMIDYRVARTR
jgi:hypothetical protein